jgi:hypothetical protein
MPLSKSRSQLIFDHAVWYMLLLRGAGGAWAAIPYRTQMSSPHDRRFERTQTSRICVGSSRSFDLNDLISAA